MTRHKRWQLAGLALVVITAGSIASTLTGCHTMTSCLCPPDVVGQDKGGAQLWADNCTRCHANRPATTYRDAEWDVAAHHMRVRANLTAVEHQKIVEFLKSGN